MEKSKKKMVDLIATKSLDPGYAPDVWFSSNIFMVFGLPAQRLKDNPIQWVKKTSFCDLTITRNSKYEIPYGCYARMNQIFIDTEVRTKNTNEIDVGRCFNEYVRKLGYKEGRANKALLRQLINYVTSILTVDIKHEQPGRITGVNSLVARYWDVHFDVKNPEQLMLVKGKILLDEAYANWVHKHSVPLNMDIVNVFKRNPLALDFYRFLAYRNNDLRKTIAFPDRELFDQFGTEQQADFVIRGRLRKILRIIQAYWPVKAKFEDGFFELHPSPPAVQKRLPSSGSIKIVKLPEIEGNDLRLF